MLLFLLHAFANDDLRARCTLGEAAACDALAVQLTSRVVQAHTHGATSHLAQVLALLTADASRWPVLAARPQGPRCLGTEGCLPPKPDEPRGTGSRCWAYGSRSSRVRSGPTPTTMAERMAWAPITGGSGEREGEPHAGR